MKRTYTRPKSVTEDDIAIWRLEYQENEDHARMDRKLHEAAPNWEPADRFEMFCTHMWLERELNKLGVEEETANELQMSMGQKQTFADDVWIEAEQALKDFQNGCWDKPGPELARKLSEKYMPKLTGRHVPPPPGDILDLFYTINTSSIEVSEDAKGQNGIKMPNAIFVGQDGGVLVACLAMYGANAAQDSYLAIYKMIKELRPIELVFGLDRYAGENQGTTRKNVFSVHYWNRGVWKIGIIEYDTYPEVVVDKIRWDNEFWIEALSGEMCGFFVGKMNIDKNPYPPKFDPVPTQEQFEKIIAFLKAGNRVGAAAYLEQNGYTELGAEHIIKSMEFVREP